MVRGGSSGQAGILVRRFLCLTVAVERMVSACHLAAPRRPAAQQPRHAPTVAHFEFVRRFPHCTVKTALFAFSIFALVGCATPDRRGVDYERYDPPAARGKFVNYSPILILHCRSDFHAPVFPELQRHFLTPLALSEYRFVIDRIEIDATSEVADNWTAELHLDTGARIALTESGEFWDGSFSFDAALRRTFSKLDAEQRRDPKLRRYIQEHGRRIALRPRSA